MAPERCPACGAAAAPRRGPEVRGYRFLRCSACRTLYLPAEQRVHADSLYEDDRYFVNPEFGGAAPGAYHGYRDYLADREPIQEKFREVVARVEELLGGTAGGRLVDIGAGPGFLVAAARERGWDAVGVDVNPWAAGYARERLGVEVRLGGLDDAGLEEGAYDAVTMMDLLEHVEDPAALVRAAARLLRPGGVLAVLTPDAGSPVSRLMGRRWPEVQRAPEHLVLLSSTGLDALAGEAGLLPLERHSVGKRTTLATLAADASPLWPRAGEALARRLERSPLGRRMLHVDPRTKFCAYFRRQEGAAAAEENVLRDLHRLARARTLSDWMFEELAAGHARGRVAEVGAGIGTFSARLLEAGIDALLLVEPEEACHAKLAARFGDEPRVELSREALPDARSLAPRSFDLVVCQNVLEHVDDDAAAVRAMAEALAPGGTLSLLVPAGPRLYGALDIAYGHRRRYERERLRAIVEDSGLEVVSLRPFNLLGVPGWWLSNLRGSAGIGPVSLAAYDLLARAWKPLERRLRLPWGLSLICQARRPGEPR